MQQINWNDLYKNGREYVHLSRHEIDKILTYLQGDIGRVKVLDLGCGTGHLTRELYHKGFENIVGIDGSAEAVSLAKAATVFPIKYIVDDLEQDFTSKLSSTFDLVVCKDTLAFIETKGTFLQKVNSVLTSGGLFVLTSPLRSEFPDRQYITLDTEETKELLQPLFELKGYFISNKEEFYICQSS